MFTQPYGGNHYLTVLSLLWSTYIYSQYCHSDVLFAATQNDTARNPQTINGDQQHPAKSVRLSE